MKNIVMKWNILVSSFLRMMFVVYVFAVLLRLKAPFVSDMKSNFITLVVIGVIVSIPSTWRLFKGENLLSFTNILGTVLGIAAVLVIVAVHTEKPILFIHDASTAFITLAVLLLVKIGIRVFQENHKTIEPDSG
jgi:hypothetical protein